MIRRIISKVARWLLADPATHGAFPVVGPSWIAFKEYVDVHPTVLVDAVASVRIIQPPRPIHPCVTIGEGSHVFSSFNVLRAGGKITVGRRCQLGASQFISALDITVGDDVVMAWGNTIIDSDNHSLYWSERQFDVERCRRDYLETKGQDIARSHDWSGVGVAPIRIGDKAWIGFNVIILKGVTIGEGAIIGAGSVVTKDIPPWSIAAGNPCRVIREVARQR